MARAEELNRLPNMATEESTIENQSVSMDIGNQSRRNSYQTQALGLNLCENVVCFGI